MSMLTENLHALAANPALVLGWAMAGGLLVQVGLLVTSGVRRLVHESSRSRLEQERLALEIRAAMLRIQTVEQSRVAWNGIRKFTVTEKIAECADTFSFHLQPHDRKALPSFRPGQYLTFQLLPPGASKPLIRCYSLSDCARQTHYRVTIKRCLPPSGTDHPAGVSSSFFYESVKVGDILDVKAPSGHFYLDLEKPRPVVLISGGVGVTPMIAMANALTEAGSSREIWFFFGARNSQEHMFKSAMADLAARHPNVRMHVCYSKPRATDATPRDYQHEGRVTVELFKKLLPSNNYEYFLCGPGPFMETITEDLRAWGVPDAWVHFEAFGPASVKRAAPPATKAALHPAPGKNGDEVTFAKSGQTVPWNAEQTSLLELAEAHGIKLEAGCRAGNCGACLVAIKSGEIEYLGQGGAEPEAGSCLACICKPKGRLVIDA